MYKDIKIDRFPLKDNVKDHFDTNFDFNIIDNYKKDIEKYIYTDIKMTDGSNGIEEAFQSRLQILLSSVLLRSLLLKEGLVIVLNNNNFPAYYSILKSFLEVPALLGYITDFIHNNDDYEKIISKMKELQLGNREAGVLSVGTLPAINVMTMFEKLDRVIEQIAIENSQDNKEKEKIIENENMLLTVYKDICNFGHINFNAHLPIGVIDQQGVWRGARDIILYKQEMYGFYMPAFTIAIGTIKMCCSLLVRDSKVDNFNLLSNKSYF